MKTIIFNLTDHFPDKVNFVDSQNTLVGYDLYQCCCENAFWVISPNKDGSEPLYHSDKLGSSQTILEGYTFDPDFFERDDNEDHESYSAIFKLEYTNWESTGGDLYLRLENNHNGYYSHGFTFKGNKTIEGSL